MDRLRVLASRLLGLLGKRRLGENLEAELHAHLQLLTEENIRRGMSPEEGDRAARRQFGGVEQTKEAYGEQRGLPLVESVVQDLRYGARILRKNPGFTLAAAFTLALGIGANAAVFSLVGAVLLHPMPYRDPSQLFLLSETMPKQGNDELGVSAAEYFDYRDQNHGFSQVAAYETVNPIGKRFYWGDRDMFTVIGVAADVRVSALDADPAPMVYNSMFQVESGASSRTAFVLRLANANQPTQRGIFPAVQERVWSVDKDLPLYGETTLNELVAASVAQRRFTMLLMVGFAAIALALAVIGLYGAISYLVAQRTRELAIRIALGADRGRVGWMIVRQAMMLGLAGCSIGLGLFALMSPLFAANLYHVRRFDPLTMTAIPALLLGVVVLAAHVPARRAMRVDPIVALRYE
jgi:FtsX-like permease family